MLENIIAFAHQKKIFDLSKNLNQKIELKTTKKRNGKIIIPLSNEDEEPTIEDVPQDFFGKITKIYAPINKRVIIPNDEESKKNKRSRSAKLRIAEKI